MIRLQANSNPCLKTVLHNQIFMYIDAALFYQNVDVKIAEQFFEKALNAGGHANGHCLALMSLFYHNFEKDDVKSIHWAKNAVHLDVTMKSFLRKRGIRFNLHDDGTEY